MMQEIWKDIPGFEGRYQVSNTGKVLSLNFRSQGKAKCLKPTANEHGYLAVIFYIKSKPIRFFVHRLVAEAFLPKGNGMNEVNHKDGNKGNNVYTNLEWCTSGQNKAHGVKTGLYNGMVEKVIQQMKPMIATNLKSGEQHLFYSLTDAHNFTGGNKANISKVLHGSQNSCKGYTFKYIDGGEEVCKDLILSRLKQKKHKRDLSATSPLFQEVAY
jgi:hypothetical protein